MQYYKVRKVKEPVNYEESYWGTITDPDGNVRNRLDEREMYLDDIKQELTFLNSLPGGKILDIGCGLGFLLSELSDKFDKYGVEVSKCACNCAENYGKIFNGYLEDADFPDEEFDVIVMHHVIEHVEKPEEIIKEIYRILKKNGHLLIATPDFDSACARRFGENYRMLHDKTHVSLFTNESMYRFLRDFGFFIEKVEYPFFETRHFTKENLMKLFDTNQISPPFYGNFMTFYCKKV
ncbi:MAG: class I SAM-dependent methyltransferase [Candidatus Gastranaerophilales bacterium]|nr:class I SAM-dependent methyltransferase [Candidatus Gastranaerophilales bacterium]